MGAIFSEALILNGLEGGYPLNFRFLQENVVKLTDRNSHHGHFNIYNSDMAYSHSPSCCYHIIMLLFTILSCWYYCQKLNLNSTQFQDRMGQDQIFGVRPRLDQEGMTKIFDDMRPRRDRS